MNFWTLKHLCLGSTKTNSSCQKFTLGLFTCLRCLLLLSSTYKNVFLTLTKPSQKDTSLYCHNYLHASYFILQSLVISFCKSLFLCSACTNCASNSASNSLLPSWNSTSSSRASWKLVRNKVGKISYSKTVRIVLKMIIYQFKNFHLSVMLP